MLAQYVCTRAPLRGAFPAHNPLHDFAAMACAIYQKIGSVRATRFEFIKRGVGEAAKPAVSGVALCED